MSSRPVSLWVSLVLVCSVMQGCEDPEPTPPDDFFQQTPEPDQAPEPEPEPIPEPDPEPEGPLRAVLSHSYGDFDLEPFEERSPCVQWTLNNEEPIYVERVSLSNNGSYHHSNWFVVPEEHFEGPDGFFRCRTRDFDELEAALLGTVLFAQSTQSQFEAQYLGEGVVIKIPPRHKVIADVHLLNLAPRDVTTELRMSLDLVHPSEVDVVVAPFRLSYLDLDIAPRTKSRFTGECSNIGGAYERVARRDFDLKLYWVLPHLHQLGDHFRLEIVGGPRDGEVIYNLDGFNADANGLAFNPPLDLSGAEGLRFTCGYDNPRSERVGWGIGDQEMCVMLGFAEGGAMIDASVINDSEVLDTDEEGTVYNGGPCLAIALPRNDAQTMPDEAEINAPLYVPDNEGPQGDVSPVIICEDTPADAVAEQPVTLTSMKESIFVAGCTFGACHDQSAPAAGLDLSGEGLHEMLLSHPGRGHADMPLVAPGDPEGSWLYQVLSRCEPTGADDSVRTHMPLNAPALLDPGLVAKVRDWIAAGALDD